MEPGENTPTNTSLLESEILSLPDKLDRTGFRRLLNFLDKKVSPEDLESQEGKTIIELNRIFIKADQSNDSPFPSILPALNNAENPKMKHRYYSSVFTLKDDKRFVYYFSVPKTGTFHDQILPDAQSLRRLSRAGGMQQEYDVANKQWIDLDDEGIIQAINRNALDNAHYDLWQAGNISFIETAATAVRRRLKDAASHLTKRHQ